MINSWKGKRIFLIGCLFFAVSLGFFCIKNKSKFVDVTKYGYEQYQDIIINNAIAKKASSNHHDCDTRYRLIQKILNKYKYPFTMLDIGASQGYYSFRAAHDYDCVCVMIEGNNPAYPMVGGQLFDLCKANDTLNNIILLQKPIVPEDLQRLSECESFNVVLAMNIIHWFGPRWKEVADSIINMGDNMIIETPPCEDFLKPEQNEIRKSIEEYLLSKNAQILGKVPRHTSETMSTIYVIEGEKKRFQRKQWLLKKNEETAFEITSNYEARTIKKFPPHVKKETIFPWQPGINLITFLMYNGTYPLRETIVDSLKKLKNSSHKDWNINNMILQKKNLVLIDWEDPMHSNENARPCSEKLLKAHCDIMKLKDPKKIEKFFWGKIIDLSD